MSKTGCFIAGACTALLIEVLLGCGFVYGYAKGLPDLQPTVAPEGKISREITFRVLTPPGAEEMGYVQLDCKPNMLASKLRSGKKISGRHNVAVLVEPPDPEPLPKEPDPVPVIEPAPELVPEPELPSSMAE